MNNTKEKIIEVLNEFKKQQDEINSKYWYSITITFATETFYRKLNGVSSFYKKLANSKAKLLGLPSNREWWKSLRPSGFYDFTPKKDVVVLSYVIETKSKLNQLEFKSRVKKIVPFIEISIRNITQKEYQFEVDFMMAYYLKYEQKTEVFGDIKRNSKKMESPI